MNNEKIKILENEIKEARNQLAQVYAKGVTLASIPEINRHEKILNDLRRKLADEWSARMKE